LLDEFFWDLAMTAAATGTRPIGIATVLAAIAGLMVGIVLGCFLALATGLVEISC